MPKGTCSICASPVLREVNEALAKGERLRDLAARSGHSRASLSRHSRKCISRNKLAQHSTVLSDYLSGRANLVVLYPGDDQSAVREQDIIVQIEYEKALDPSNAPNPYPLLTKEERAAYDEQQAAARLGADKVADIPKTSPQS
jgi:hypothetical protein